MRVLSEDRRMAAGDHCLLDIPPVDEQFGHSPAVAICRDPADDNGLIHQHPVQVVLRCHGWGRSGVLALQRGSVDAGQPDFFSCGCRAGIAVVAAFDGHAG